VLVMLRSIWGAMIIGLVLMGLVLSSRAGGPPDAAEAVIPNTRNTYAIVMYAMLLLAVPAGYFVRNQLYKSGWREHAVTPQAYFIGNIILFSVLEGLTFSGFMLSVMVDLDPIVLIPGAIGFALLLLNFPTGKPMQPREPRFGRLPS